MNKRNTEGYVLAYLLIVIAVMGAIAATLMTSTVQVMAAQQNSIRYMQDKYEVQGELERLVADLDYLHPSSEIISASFLYADDAIDDAVKCFATYLKNNDTFDLTNYPLIAKEILPDNTENVLFDISYCTEKDTISLSIEFSNHLTRLNTSITFSPITEVINNPIIDVPDNLDTPDVDETESHMEYKCKVTGTKNFTFSSYEINSIGGGT